VPVVLPERLLHTAKAFTNSLHCNSIPLPISDTSLHTCCSDTVVDESKQQNNPCRLRKIQLLEICSASCNI
jgi:hypothetical protein